MTPLEIGHAVKTIREGRALTQKELAVQVGVSGNTLGKIERGEPVQRAKLNAVADALGIELHQPAADEHTVESAKMMVELWMRSIPPARQSAALAALAETISRFKGH